MDDFTARAMIISRDNLLKPADEAEGFNTRELWITKKIY